MINIVDDYNPTNGDKIREMTDYHVSTRHGSRYMHSGEKRLLRVLLGVSTAASSRRELN